MLSSSLNTINLLKSYGIRPSVQRVAVMDYLQTHRTHPTAETIYEELAPEIPTLSKTTVYNTLSLFVEKGAATRVTIDNREARYDGDVSVHGHFLCEQCGELYDVHYEQAPEIPFPANHRVKQTHVYYSGICEHCLEQIH